MTRYRLDIILEFDTATDLQEISVSGPWSLLEKVIEGFPDPPGDVDESTSNGSIFLSKV